MKLPKRSVKRPITTIMMMFLIVMLGMVSLTNLKTDLMPKINPPVVGIMTVYPGANPEEVTEMVTKPIEEIVGTSSGLENMNSISSANSSLVIAQFNWGLDISEIREDVSTKLAQVNLPEDVERPMILKFDPSMVPLVQMSVSKDGTQEELQDFIENVVSPTLKNVSGVANVDVLGVLDREIRVTLKNEELKKYNLTKNDISQLIQGNNVLFPGGTIEDERKKYSLSVMGKVETIEELKMLPIHVEQSNQELEVVLLKEVAIIEEVFVERTSVARVNKEKAMFLTVQKGGDANTVEVSQLIKEEMDELLKKYSDLEILYPLDQGEIIERSMNNVTLSLLYGAFFASIVILVFLRTFSATIIVAISIPFSVVSTFVFMYFSNMTLNIMSIGGLALGVGMLVDNAIIVIENIYRHLALGKDRKKAAIEGTKEVGGAITASMLTTLSVFIPIMFVEGMVGDLFKELALTVAFSLISSWIVALTVVPVLASLLLKKKIEKKEKKNNFYHFVINWALKNRILTLFVTFLIVAVSVTTISKVGTEFMPATDEGSFFITIDLPNGTSLEGTEDFSELIEEVILKDSSVDMVSVEIGTGNALWDAATGTGETRITTTVKLLDKEERSKETKTIMNEMEKKIERDLKDRENLDFDYEELTFSYDLTNSNNGLSSTEEVEIVLSGKTTEELIPYVEELTKKLKEEGFENIDNSLENSKPEYHYFIDKEKAFKYGLTTAQVGMFIRENLQGKNTTKISKNGEEISVRIFSDEKISTIKDIEKLKILTPIGIEVELKEIGEINLTDGPVNVPRRDQKFVINMSVELGDNSFGKTVEKVQKVIDETVEELDIETAYTDIQVAGEAQDMIDAFDSLLIAFALALIFVYMVMASQFESLVQPFIIMFTVPLAITGVVFGLILTNYAFGVTAFIGVIILLGIVVNNAIVFLDYTNQLIEKGFEVKNALIEAGTTRLRPILMTALTTMLGLLPLAIGAGEGAEIQAPMAIAVIGGLFTSTLLTLIVIPVIYSLFYSIKGIPRKIRFLKTKLKEFEEEEKVNSK